MRKKIEQIMNKVESGDLAYHDAVDELLLLYNVMPSLPSHIDAGIEAKNYGNKMNKLADNPTGFHELDFYNGTVWLRQMIEGNDANRLLAEVTPRQKFISEMQYIISKIDAFDKETTWQHVEPEWWLEMMNIRKKVFDAVYKFNK